MGIATILNIDNFWVYLGSEWDSWMQIFPSWNVFTIWVVDFFMTSDVYSWLFQQILVFVIFSTFSLSIAQI